MTQSFTYAGTSDYIAAPDLMQTVNVAMQLSRPLLIKGEPGTGKTMLAQSIARGLEIPLIVWSVKSTTKAQDGLYVCGASSATRCGSTRSRSPTETTPTAASRSARCARSSPYSSSPSTASPRPPES